MKIASAISLPVICTLLLLSCNSNDSPASKEEVTKLKADKKLLVPGEQAPLADQDQNSFGRIRRVGTTKQKSRPGFARPEPEVGTIHFDSITMSDPFVFPDKKSKTYYLTGTGGRLYKSKDLSMWTGPYKMIDLTGTWMDSL